MNAIESANGAAAEQTQTLRPQTIQDVQDTVQQAHSLLARGGGTKPALSGRPAATVLDLRDLTGIQDYAPSEYTFTALAGTPLREIEAALAQHNQYLPFDPVLVDAGSTVGGAIATGLSGSGRQRYGGIRDFLIGVRLVDGHGRLVLGGGKVVKNAAGFDLPKLMVGSLGRLGTVVEATFKVFPRPQAYATARFPFATLAAATESMNRLASAPLDLDVLDLLPQEAGAHLLVRLGGLPQVLDERMARIGRRLGVEPAPVDDEADYWRSVREFGWADPDHAWIKVPVAPARLRELDALLALKQAPRRYAAAGHLAWVSWPGSVTSLDHGLAQAGFAGLLLRGGDGQDLIGAQPGTALLTRIKTALDPEQRFV